MDRVPVTSPSNPVSSTGQSCNSTQSFAVHFAGNTSRSGIVDVVALVVVKSRTTRFLDRGIRRHVTASAVAIGVGVAQTCASSASAGSLPLTNFHHPFSKLTRFYLEWPPLPILYSLPQSCLNYSRGFGYTSFSANYDITRTFFTKTSNCSDQFVGNSSEALRPMRPAWTF